MSAARSPQPNLSEPSLSAGVSRTVWLQVLLTGLASGVAAALLMKLLRLVQHLAWGQQGGDSFLEAVERTSSPTRVLVLLGVGVLVALVLPLIARLPRRGSGGLEAVIWFRNGRLPILATLAKAVFSIVIVALGASLGRESGPKQIGALIGSELARLARLAGPQRRLLAACGAGAGIAAVYNVPLGGALFALEVLLGTLSMSLVAPTLLATLSGTMAYWLFFPNEPTYHTPPMALTTSLVVFAIVTAPLAGLASALFVKLIAFASRSKPNGWRIWPAALVVFGGLGLLAIPFPQLLGNGRNVVERAALDQIIWPALVMLMLLKPLTTAACLGTGAPGGLLTPTLAFGALLGGVAGHVWTSIWPGTAAGAYPIVMATAVLAATTKGPISALVLMVELTRLDDLLVPMSIAVAIAIVIAHRLDPRSTYTSRASRSRPTVDGAIWAATSVADLSLHLASHSEGPARVIDEAGAVIGEVSRDDLRATSAALVLSQIATAGDIVDACRERNAR